MVMKYFSNLFISNGSTSVDEILGCVLPMVMEDMNYELGAPITDEEVRCDVFQMHTTKAPGSDGMTPGFYKKTLGNCWSGCV